MPLHNLRIATANDIDLIVSLLKKMKAESIYGPLKEEDTEIRATVDIYFGLSKSVIILYDDIGFICGRADKLPFSKEIQACEIAWFVEPEHRNTKVGSELYSAFEYWATDIIKAKVIHTASPNGSPLGSMYDKLGYKKLEEVYIKVL